MKTHHRQLAYILCFLLAGTLAAAAEEPIVVNAHDLLTKVYGIIDCGEQGELSRDNCCASAERLIGLLPGEDADALWLETADGFSINYSGMQPEVAATADFDGDTLTGHTYFFIFPTDESKCNCCSEQVAFCGCLLQEMYDLGADMTCCDQNFALFQAIGEYAGRSLDVRLLEEPARDSLPGRYLLILSVARS